MIDLIRRYCQKLLMKRITQIVDKDVRTSYHKDIEKHVRTGLKSLKRYVRIS